MSEESPRPRLVVASQNRAKAREIAEILAAEGLAYEVVTLAEFPAVTLPPETGATFAENAVVKARAAAAATGLPAIGDDSGLEVDALGGEPGVLSARYAGEGASDADRYQKVLALLADVPDARRTARFRCAAAFAAPDGTELLAEGKVEGRLAPAPAGTGGFGYDPIFLPEGRAVTMAQLTPEDKHAISHRGRALRALAARLRAANALSG
ncbi:MAG: RdgB/HAM1 family non-canonical purine NTP pyrophosphatase [Gemmatimonadales bacterium]|nr:RdgB/HAM1 family non-canonical purine NTP pyrophosphatase [Gemmatimonadales bacterium]